MGFESFNLTLRQSKSSNVFLETQIGKYILGYSEFVKPDEYYGQQVDSPTFIYNDDESLFEVKLHCSSQQISIRYAFCNPVAIESKVCQFAYSLAKNYGLELSVQGQEDIDVFDFNTLPPDQNQVCQSIIDAAQQGRQLWRNITAIDCEAALRPGQALDMLIKSED